MGADSRRWATPACVNICRQPRRLGLRFLAARLVLVGIDLIALARAPRGEVAALAEHPAIAALRVGEDLPPVVVEVREVKRVGAVLVGGLGDLLQPPLLLALVEDAVGAEED